MAVAGLVAETAFARVSRKEDGNDPGSCDSAAPPVSCCRNKMRKAASARNKMSPNNSAANHGCASTNREGNAC